MKNFLCVVALMLGCLCQLQAQSRIIKGKVTDDKGAPLSGASVLAKGTTIGVTTDMGGTYTISIPATVTVLTVSSLNHVSQDVRIGDRTSVDVKLVSQTENLNEVVVVGYSNVDKRSLTGSVAKISGNDVANKPVLSFDQALTGKAAGVQINTSSGLIGDVVNIRVRGAASISSGSQPLIVMDGVPLTQGNNGQLYNPVNPLADINPNDIESVDVLKDASAAAIYGSRASGGVILITTKRGKSGQSKITYDGYVGMNTLPSRTMNVLNADQYVSVLNQMRSNAGLTNIASRGDYNGDGKPDETNWADEVYRKGLTQSHQVSISGGAGRTTYFGSVNYNDFENFIIVNRQKRGSARLNLTSKVNDWLEIGVKMQYSKTTSFGLGTGAGAALSGMPFGQLTGSPNLPVYDANGEYYIGQGGNLINNNTPNPLAVQELNFDTRTNDRFIGSAYADITLYKGLKFKSQFNVDNMQGYTDQYWDPTVGDGTGLAGLSQVVSNDVRVWSWFNTLNYNLRIKDHDLSFLGGIEYTKNDAKNVYAYGIGIIDPNIRYISTANYATVDITAGLNDNSGLASYFGGANYGYKGKYMASVNFRSDAYSGFGIANRWGYFPSGSVAWRISEENFWRMPAVKDLKLRMSYGITGNSNIGLFPSLATFAANTYADLPASNLQNPGNSSLKWEQTGQFDIGFDATIGKGINVTFDYYKKKTNDLILNNPVLATVGVPGNTITENIGSMEATGLELSISLPVMKTKNFNWNLNFNAAYNRNKVITTNANGDDIAGGAGLARPGYDLGAFYLIRWAGVNPENGFPMFYDRTGVLKQYDHAAAVANRWTLVSNKQVTTAITANDRVLDNKKTPYPKLFGGISQSLSYKNFDFSIDIQYALGFHVYNSTLSTLMLNTTSRNKSEQILSAWKNPGDVTNVPKLYWGENQSTQNSTRWLEKADFARIRNVQIGYNLPQKMLDRVKLSRLRVYAQAQNLFTFTGYNGIDPESNSNGNVNIGLGIDQFRPYLPTSFTFGVNVGL